MLVEAFLNALRSMPLISAAALTKAEPFVVLSPHPDDESLGTGGLIAAACAAGQRADVIILTDGAGSHPRSQRFPPAELAALRRTESERAASRLGLSPEKLIHLGLADTQAPSRGPAFEQAVEQLMSVVRAARATSIFVTWGRDPHCDHQAADRMARALRTRDPSLKLWSYPIWGWHLDPGGSVDEPAPDGFRIDITPWLAVKRAAIQAHASQMTDLITDDPHGFRFDDRSLAPFVGRQEYFFKVPA